MDARRARAARPARTRRMLVVGDRRFRVLSSPGAHDHDPVVLVHGVGMSHRYLDRLHRALAPRTSVHSVDLPGFGGLARPDDDLDVVSMGRALSDALDALALGRPAVLFGHSMGAQWVVEAALQRPDLVARVVAMGPVADVAHRSFAAQTTALVLDTVREDPRVAAMVVTDVLVCGVPWYAANVRHMLDYALEERVADLRMPLLVIRGERDPVAGLSWCRAVAQAAPDGRLVEIPRRRHLAQFDAPDAVADAIIEAVPLSHGTTPAEAPAHAVVNPLRDD